MGFVPWKFNISANKIAIYAAAASKWSAFLRYSGNLASKSAVKAFSCSSLSLKIPWRLAIKAYIRMQSDLLKVMSAISSTRKKNSSPSVLWSSFWRCSIASNIYRVNTIATWAVSASYDKLWHSPTRFSMDLQVLKKTSICHGAFCSGNRFLWYSAVHHRTNIWSGYFS